MTDPPLMFHNGMIRTMNDACPTAEAVVVRDGRISFVGGLGTAREEYPDARMHDLKGMTLVPGFIDSHQHLVFTGLSLTGLDFSGDRRLADIFSAIREQAGRTDPGGWVRGYSLHEDNIAENRLPRMEELDEIAPDHFVVLFHVSMHVCVVNSKMFRALNFQPDLPGLEYHRGRFTGKIQDPAIIDAFNALSELIREEDRLAAIQIAAQKALAAGITTLHCLDGGELARGDARFLVQHQDEMPLRTVIYDQTLDIDEVMELGLPRIGGCILADGAIENHTAALFQPYDDEPGNSGLLTYPNETMEAFVAKAHNAGLQIGIHAIGDRAIEQVLTAYEKALRASPRRDHRHRIEHLELPTPDQLERIAAAGIAVSIQPMFIPLCAGGPTLGFFRKLLGEERIRRFHPYRTLLDLGVLVAGGSDSPVTPYAPLESIYWSCAHPIAEHRLGIEEGLQLFTINAAKIGFEEDQKGSIEVGKLADFAVLSGDPLAGGGEDLKRITVQAAIVGGKIRFSHD